MEMKKYVVKEGCTKGKDIIFELGGIKSQLRAEPLQEVLLPVNDNNGDRRHMKEKVTFSKDARYPLLASNNRRMTVNQQGLLNKVQAVDNKGQSFWVPVKKVNGMPVIELATSSDQTAQAHCSKAAETKAQKIYKSPANLKKQIENESLSKEERIKVLLSLHKRLAHATGSRLHMTLKEKGWNDIFTQAECNNIQCETCQLLNRRLQKVPSVKDPLRSELNAGEEAYQDLLKMPKGVGGCQYISNVIDASTRRISAMALKSKDESLIHCISYVRLLEKLKQPVKTWRSDNGGEFANEAYKNFLMKEGIQQKFGAPYTPQSQGLVERANGTLKRLIGKVLRTLGLPVHVWPGLLPGVVRILNSVVNTAVGKSPLNRAGDHKSTSMPEFAVGDVVSVVHPLEKKAYEGYYGGQISESVVSVIIRAKKQWRVLRVHPSAVKLIAWQGLGRPLVEGNRDLQVGGDDEESYIPADSEEYDVIDVFEDESQVIEDSQDAVTDSKVDSGKQMLQEYVPQSQDPEPQIKETEEEDSGDEGDIHWFVPADDEDISSDRSNIARCLSVKTVKISQNKAKNQVEASREEIKTGSHTQADLKELQSFYDLKVLSPLIQKVTPQIKEKTFSAGWRRTWKGEGDTREPKSRLYVRGFQEKRDRGWLETYSGTMNAGQMRLAIVYALHRRWKAAKTDIKTAFLQTVSDDELYVKLPLDISKTAQEKFGFVPGGVYRQLKAVYGRIDSPRLFTQAFKKSAFKCGWKEVAESILTQQKNGEVCGILFMHMDDLICLEEKPEEKLKQLDVYFKMGSITNFRQNESNVYTGLDIVWNEQQQECKISQERYAQNIKTDLSEREKRKQFGPENLRPSGDNEINMSLKEDQQSWTGVLGWLAKTQPHLCVLFSEVSTNSTRPSPRSVKNVQMACEYARKTHKHLIFKSVKDPVLLIWVDASYNIKTCSGRIGLEAQVVDVSCLTNGVENLDRDNLFFWRSRKCSRKLASTSSAELMALLEGVKIVPTYISIVEKLWCKKPRVIFLTDSQPLLGWLRKGWVDTDPHLQGTVDLVKERINDMNARVLWVQTKSQKADRQTKFIKEKI